MLKARSCSIRFTEVRNAIGKTWLNVEGSGNAYSGFKEFSAMVVEDGIKLTYCSNPDPRYDCFHPNPHTSVITVKEEDLEEAIDQLVEHSDGLRSGINKIKGWE